VISAELISLPFFMSIVTPHILTTHGRSPELVAAFPRGSNRLTKESRCVRY